MTTIDLTAGTFEQAVADNDIVLVDFWAAWCGPCRNFAPVYETASAFHPGVLFGKVDTEAERELAGAAGIRSIPTLMVFREGFLIYAQPGAMPAKALDELIGAVKAADMDAVRAEFAEQAAKESAESPA